MDHIRPWTMFVAGLSDEFHSSFDSFEIAWFILLSRKRISFYLNVQHKLRVCSLKFNWYVEHCYNSHFVHDIYNAENQILTAVISTMQLNRLSASWPRNAARLDGFLIECDFPQASHPPLRESCAHQSFARVSSINGTRPEAVAHYIRDHRAAYLYGGWLSLTRHSRAALMGNPLAIGR